MNFLRAKIPSQGGVPGQESISTQEILLFFCPSPQHQGERQADFSKCCRCAMVRSLGGSRAIQEVRVVKFCRVKLELAQYAGGG